MSGAMEYEEYVKVTDIMDTSGSYETVPAALLSTFGNESWNNNATENRHLWWTLEKTIFALDMLMVLPICVGNVLVLLAYKTTAKLQLTSNLLLVNLAITDLLTGLVSIPWACFVHYADFGLERVKYPCLFTYILPHVPLAVSCLTMLWMAVLRFVAIVYPLKHKMWVTRTRVKVIIACLWIYVPSLVIGFAIFGNKWSDEKRICDLSAVMPGIYVTIFAAQLMLVCVISTVLYIYIGMTIVKSKVWVQQWAQTKSSSANGGPWSVYSRTTRSTSTAGSNSSLCVNLNSQGQKLHALLGQEDLGTIPQVSNKVVLQSYKRHGSHDQISLGCAVDPLSHGQSPTRTGSISDNHWSSSLSGQRSPPQMGKRLHPPPVGKTSPPRSTGRKNIPSMGVKCMEGRRSSQEGATSPQEKNAANSQAVKKSNTIIRQQICQRQDSTCRMVKMLATVLGCFYLCWLPSLAKVFVSKILYNKEDEPLWLNFFEQLALTILWANSFVNPIIYAGMNRTFYRVFRKLLHLEEPANRDSSTLS